MLMGVSMPVVADLMQYRNKTTAFLATKMGLTENIVSGKRNGEIITNFVTLSFKVL